ncbi:hypothetical protein [Micromonospora sp. CA-248212]|uniref:hypothetical protein n=1 Tax=Micromonospora sp. CA-248212 TaxID=3239961 RepID=UPI003D948889
MTPLVQHTIVRTDDTARVLPGSSDSQAWTVPLVAGLAGTSVDEVAHTLAHPVPQHGCPYGGCVDATVTYRNPSAEQTWREDALVSPVRHEVNV